MEDMMAYHNITLGRSIYLYPKGGCAQVVANILKDYDNHLVIDYIDDSIPELSLKTQQAIIRKHSGMVLVCGGDVHEDLVAQCNHAGLKHIDGRELAAFIIGQKLDAQQEAIRQGEQAFELIDSKTLHVFDTRWLQHYYFFYDLFVWYLKPYVFAYLTQKALAYCVFLAQRINSQTSLLEHQHGITALFEPRGIPLLLKEHEERFNVLWLFGSFEFYERVKHHVRNRPVIIAPYCLMDFFARRSVFLNSGSSLPKLIDLERKTIGIGHTFSDAYVFCAKTQKHEYLLQYLYYYFLGMEGYASIDKGSSAIYRAIFDALGLKMKIYCLGSPSLDERILPLSECAKPPVQFYFIPRACALDDIASAMKLLLKHNKKVVFRAHPAFNRYVEYLNINNAYNAFKDCLAHPLFSFCDSPSITPQALAQSIVVTDNSSVAYSAPLINLRPSILFCPPRKEFDLRARNFGHSFANPILHRVVLDVKDFLHTALELEATLAGGGQNEDIWRWRHENVYNLGHCKESCMEFFIQLMER